MSTPENAIAVESRQRSAPSLPPLRTIIKSREVEDPVNTWVHRPLAYLIVALVYRTRITPNQITFLALLLGVSAAGFWVVGSAEALAIGGVLLWVSAVADGADGLLARAKRSHSLFGRALDGSADAIVAIATMSAVLWYFLSSGFLLEALLLPVAIVLTVAHMQHYDFYKEVYLAMTRTDGGHDLDNVDAMRAQMESLGEGGWVARIAVHFFATPHLERQKRMLGITNPEARRLFDTLRGYCPDGETAKVYRRHNRWLMQAWAAISLAPHTYLISIFAILTMLDTYLWVRLLLMNMIFIVALVLQRRATRATLRELERLNLGPEGLTKTTVRVTDV